MVGKKSFEYFSFQHVQAVVKQQSAIPPPSDVHISLVVVRLKWASFSYYSQCYIQHIFACMFNCTRTISHKINVFCITSKYVLLFLFPGKTCRRNWETEVWTGSNETEGWFFNWTHLVKVVFCDKSFLTLSWNRHKCKWQAFTAGMYSSHT